MYVNKIETLTKHGDNMTTLTIVNKFISNNNFIPTELYTKNGYVVIKYDKNERNEYEDLMKEICRTSVMKLNKIKVTFVPGENKMLFAPKGGK